MAWLVLFFAGLFEVVWATAMKMSEGFTKAVPTGIMVAAMLLSFILLAWSMRVLPLGTAYTIWTGIGALGAFIVGVAVFGEPLGFLRIFAALLIVSGLVLMKLATPG
ncbi:Quaternary ammonium compound-resistance protein SugE (plasmid) [Croceibacterium atlanticum]|uniref:Guanidinium exporter n=2 Tax=Croceibacterium atlanticum TaxID=1267766 RepID=A0A0F7KZQ0_9SPHN|nr:multidrug efflux SMR transporter [Croceibacterium atlanticum]AKH44330.1 Quaternary ammonium compound-resistance protein SugE [Croceibacterium atlanticum]